MVVRHIITHKINLMSVNQAPGFPLFYWQNKSRTFQDPMKNFPGPFRSLQMFKYKEELQYPDAMRMERKRWQNSSTFHTVFKKAIANTNWVLYYCCLFSIWATRKMHDFQGYFSRTFQDLSVKLQDFPRPRWFSRTFRVLEFSRKKIQDFSGLSRMCGNPDIPILLSKQHHRNTEEQRQ